MKAYFYVLIGAVVAMFIHVGAGYANLTIGADVGQVYPNYVLPSLMDGRPLALSKFRGKKIILHQFASW